MAELRVERKKGSSAWLWILLLIIVIAAVIYFLVQQGYINLGAGEWLNTTIAIAGIKRE